MQHVSASVSWQASIVAVSAESARHAIGCWPRLLGYSQSGAEASSRGAEQSRLLNMAKDAELEVRAGSTGAATRRRTRGSALRLPRGCLLLQLD